MVEEMLIARVHVAVNVLQVRGQQYKYRGHVVQFLRDVGKVYKTLPLIPPNLDIILLRPSSSERNSNHDAQFRKRFRVRRRHIEIWLEFLRLHHPGYRDFVWDRAALDQLPMDGDVLDQVNIEEIAGHQGHGLAQGPMPERPRLTRMISTLMSLMLLFFPILLLIKQKWSSWRQIWTGRQIQGSYHWRTKTLPPRIIYRYLIFV